MTQADAEQGQDDSGYEEGLAGGPGAPMPLGQLAVCEHTACKILLLTVS